MPGRVSVAVSGGPGMSYAPWSKVYINISCMLSKDAKGNQSKVSGALTVEAKVFQSKSNVNMNVNRSLM